MRARGDSSAVERRGSGGKSLETLAGRERLKMEKERLEKKEEEK